MPEVTTPTGILITHCEQCQAEHPVTRKHCVTCNGASLFINPATGSCINCEQTAIIKRRVRRLAQAMHAADEHWTAELRSVYGEADYIAARYNIVLGTGSPGSALRHAYDRRADLMDRWANAAILLRS